MGRRPGANLLICGIWGKAARVANRRQMDASTELPEFALGAPETSHPEQGGLDFWRKRRLKLMPGDKMGFGCRDRLPPVRPTRRGGVGIQSPSGTQKRAP